MNNGMGEMSKEVKQCTKSAPQKKMKKAAQKTCRIRQILAQTVVQIIKQTCGCGSCTSQGDNTKTKTAQTTTQKLHKNYTKNTPNSTKNSTNSKTNVAKQKLRNKLHKKLSKKHAQIVAHK